MNLNRNPSQWPSLASATGGMCRAQDINEHHLCKSDWWIDGIVKCWYCFMLSFEVVFLFFSVCLSHWQYLHKLSLLIKMDPNHWNYNQYSRLAPGSLSTPHSAFPLLDQAGLSSSKIKHVQLIHNLMIKIRSTSTYASYSVHNTNKLNTNLYMIVFMTLFSKP